MSAAQSASNRKDFVIVGWNRSTRVRKVAIGLAEGETRWRVTTVCRLKAPPYAFSVSRNRTGSPDDGVVSSPCHITRLPRTKVPTGQPVTRRPS
jgi:hypothetical protein